MKRHLAILLWLWLPLAACGGDSTSDTDSPVGPELDDDDTVSPLPDDDDNTLPPNDDDEELPCPEGTIRDAWGDCIDACSQMTCDWGCRLGECLPPPDCQGDAFCLHAPQVRLLTADAMTHAGETWTARLEVEDRDADVERLELREIVDGRVLSLSLEPLELQQVDVELEYPLETAGRGDRLLEVRVWDAAGLISTVLQFDFQLLGPRSPFVLGGQFIAEDLGNYTRFQYAVGQGLPGEYSFVELHIAFWHGEDELLYELVQDLDGYRAMMRISAVWLEDFLPVGFGHVDAMEHWFVAEEAGGPRLEFEHITWRFR